MALALGVEALYAAQFVALEFFYRGFFLHGIRRALGYSSIFAMMVPYAMIHFGKPLPEALGSVLAGFILGTVSLKSDSIWGGCAIHIVVATSMDLLSLAPSRASLALPAESPAADGRTSAPHRARPPRTGSRSTPGCLAPRGLVTPAVAGALHCRGASRQDTRRERASRSSQNFLNICQVWKAARERPAYSRTRLPNSARSYWIGLLLGDLPDRGG